MNPDQSITLTRPDDWHLHVRDGQAMQSVIQHTARQFGRAIIMPNLRPPVTDVQQADAYRQRITAALPEQSTFNPLMTLYLTDNTCQSEITRAANSDFIYAFKLYPSGATTNSDAGVTHVEGVYEQLAHMAEVGLPLLIHGEVTDPAVDVFDREKVFIDRHLLPLLEAIPDLKVVLEHITTADAAKLVLNGPERLAATITPHHLLMNRNAMFTGGIHPHHYCLPILKRETHRQALVAAIQSGHPRFFLGTDSAPHARNAKENACGCAGIYSAHAAIELYADAFEQAGALNKLEAFASFNGADFYGLPRHTDSITLIRSEWDVPAEYPLDDQHSVVPFRAGERLSWKLQG